MFNFKALGVFVCLRHEILAIQPIQRPHEVELNSDSAKWRGTFWAFESAGFINTCFSGGVGERRRILTVLTVLTKWETAKAVRVVRRRNHTAEASLKQGVNVRYARETIHPLGITAPKSVSSSPLNGLFTKARRTC